MARNNKDQRRQGRNKKNLRQGEKEAKEDKEKKRPKKTVIALVSVSIVAIAIGVMVTVMALGENDSKNGMKDIFGQDGDKEDSAGMQENEEPYLTSPKGWTEETRWQRAGPLAVNKPVYKIGENVFFTVSGLQPHDKGNLTFYRPNGKSYFVIPFDGQEKSELKQYFKPSLRRSLNTTSVDDLTGTWTAKLEGTQYPPLQFKIIDEYLAGEKINYKSLEKKPIGPSLPNQTTTSTQLPQDNQTN